MARGACTRHSSCRAGPVSAAQASKRSRGRTDTSAAAVWVSCCCCAAVDGCGMPPLPTEPICADLSGYQNRSGDCDCPYVSTHSTFGSEHDTNTAPVAGTRVHVCSVYPT
jgi:hypothetical protein